MSGRAEQRNGGEGHGYLLSVIIVENSFYFLNNLNDNYKMRITKE